MINPVDKVLRPRIPLFIHSKCGEYLGIIDSIGEDSVIFSLLIRVFVSNVEKFLWSGEVQVYAHFPSIVEMPLTTIHYSTPFQHPFPVKHAVPTLDEIQFATDLGVK